jgi:hypothetical protein
LAKPNYGYEKRQRELAKKNKKEEKLRRKQAGQGQPADETGGQPALDGAIDTPPADETAPAPAGDPQQP